MIGAAAIVEYNRFVFAKVRRKFDVVWSSDLCFGSRFVKAIEQFHSHFGLTVVQSVPIISVESTP